LELSEEFDVDVPDKIYDEAKTVQQTIDFINGLLAKPQAA
jgi:acyl carrier protein